MQGRLSPKIALAARPLDLVEVACRAHDLLERAPMIPHAATRRLTYLVAGALALLSKLPIRSLDLRQGRLGHEFRRDGEGWRVDLLTSKTGVPIRGRLAPELTRYLDEVLLQGTTADELWSIRDERLGRPLFGNATRNFAPYGDDWLRQHFTPLIGHGPHIVRTLIFEACHLDADLDTQVAGALCGHRSALSGKAYDLDGDRHRRDRGLRALAQAASGMAQDGAA